MTDRPPGDGSPHAGDNHNPDATPESTEVERPQRSVKRNVGVLLVTQMITWSISVVLVIALPRYLGSEAIGQYRLVTSVWMIAATFVALGTQLLVTLEIARRQDHGSGIIAPTILVRCLSFVVVSCVVAGFVSLAGYGSTLVVLFVVMGLSTLVRSIGDVAVAVLQGFEDFTLPSIASIIEKFLSTAAIMVALVLGADVQVVVMIGLGGAIVHATAIYWFLRRYVSVEVSTSFGEVRSVARRGLPFLFGGFAMVAYHEMDTILMSLLVEDEQIGWYAAADRLTATSLFIPTIVMSALFPTFARLHNEDAAVARSLVDRGFRSLILVAIPIGFGLATISTPLALLLFGEEFRQSGPVLAVLSVVLMIMFLTILIGNYAVATGHERYYYALIFGGVLLTIPLDLTFIPLMNRAIENGAVGGAISYIITELVILVVAVRRFAPHVANRVNLIRLLKCMTAGSLMVAAIWPLREIFVIVPIAAGAVVYVAVVALLSTFTDEEREGARNAVIRVWSRFRRSRSHQPDGS